MTDIENMIGQIDNLDDEIFELNQTIAEGVNFLEGRKREIKSKLDLEIATLAALELKDNDYGCGTANIDSSRHKIKVVVTKKVKWDEDMLRDHIEPMIIQAGKKPEEFIKYKRSVSETDYKSFGEKMRLIFEPAREVVPSAPKITIERK